jgi:hypothetical protein
MPIIEKMMKIETKITKLLKIDVPIICGGMTGNLSISLL